MIYKNWTIADRLPPAAAGQLPDLPFVIQQILWHRGLTDARAIDDFIKPDYKSLGNPFDFRQMKETVDRLIQAIKMREPITIYGDYDADGITATAIMVETLEALGAVVNWYLPERLTEGYGLNLNAVARFANQGTKLLITVDCGTTNITEIAKAKELGLDVIVLDHHHQPKVLPAAYAIINPVFTDETYPGRNLSSGGVAFTVARGLLAATKQGEALHHPLRAGWEKWLLDLVAISTVTDMMPLTGENRTLVKFGLVVLRQTRRPGLRALFAAMGIQMEQADEYTVGFMIGPRLNAAGRLQHAALSLRLLLTRDQREARELADQLQLINIDRQRLTELAMDEALEQIKADGVRNAYATFAPHWSPGILGLVAGRLADRLWRPVLVRSENDGDIVGSGRSVPGFDIMEVMDAGRDHFRRFGGHPAACGFTLTSAEHRPDFQRWFQDYVDQSLTAEQVTRTLQVDGRAPINQFTPAVLDLLEILGPYGVNHQRPLFVWEKTKLMDAQAVGNERRHLRLTVSQDGQVAKCIAFRLGHMLKDLRPGQPIDLVIEAAWNTWQGRREPQYKVIDLRHNP